MIRAVCLGAGGHAEVLIEILQMRGTVELVGFLDGGRKSGDFIAGVPILGTDEHLADLRAHGVSHAVIGVGGFGSSAARKSIAKNLGGHGFEILSVIHPSAIISPTAVLGDGLIALAGSIVGCGATIGHHVILNTASSVDHHCQVGDFSHLGPGARLGGRVELDESVHLGIGVCVRDGVRLGSHAVVGAGAAVVADLAGHALYAGVPAQRMKSL